MLDIYVCEDNKIQLELISKYVSNTILIEQLDMQLACASTTSGKILEQAKKYIDGRLILWKNIIKILPQ